MTRESCFMFVGLSNVSPRSVDCPCTSRSMGQPLADDTLHNRIDVHFVVRAGPAPVAVTEVESVA